MSFETGSSRYRAFRGVGGGNCWWRVGREATTDQGVEVEGSWGFREAGGGIVGRAARVTGGTRGPVGVEAVEPSGSAAAATVGAAEAPRAAGCGTRGANKVARVAEARGCRAAEATEVVGWVRSRGCCAAGAA